MKSLLVLGAAALWMAMSFAGFAADERPIANFRFAAAALTDDSRKVRNVAIETRAAPGARTTTTPAPGPVIMEESPGRPAAPLQPGVYKAEPYSLLVYVPAPMDQRMLFGPQAPGRPEMPMIQPPLRLVPKDR